MFSVYVDSDSLPSRQREVLLRRLCKENCPALFVADRAVRDVLRTIEEHTAALRAPYRDKLGKDELKEIRSPIRFVVVETGTNSADDYLVENAVAPGLCITHDIPLAERMIEKGILVIDDRGNVFDASNIRERMSQRAYMAEFREMGLYVSPQKGFDRKDIENFSNSLDRMFFSLKNNWK